MATVPYARRPLHPEPSALGAVRAVRAIAAPLRLRVIRDAEGWPVIPGKLGHLEWHDGGELAVYIDRPRLIARLWAVPGVRRWQVGTRRPGGCFRRKPSQPWPA